MHITRVDGEVSYWSMPKNGSAHCKSVSYKQRNSLPKKAVLLQKHATIRVREHVAVALRSL